MAGDKKFELPDEIVEIRYLVKPTGLISDKSHILYGGLAKGSYITYRPKKHDRNDTYANVLSNEEKEKLEQLLGLPDNGLSVYAKKDNYWDTVKIPIGPDGLRLDLRDPEQYIHFKVLSSLTNVIAPDLEAAEKMYKKTYRFVIVRQGEEAKATLKKVDVTVEAYKFYAKIAGDREAMLNYLYVTGTRVAEDTDKDWMEAEIGKQVASNPVKFVQTLKDPYYETRVLFFKALGAGLITKKGNQYYSKDGEALAEPNQLATLENVINYLEASVNQQYRLLLISKTKTK